MCCAITIPGQDWGSRVSTLAMASVPPVEAPIASTVPAGSAGAARRAGEDGLASRGLTGGFRAADAGGRGGADFLRQVVAQFSYRVRTAGFGQNLDGAEFQRL